jgi:6-phosphogluconolactonase
MSAPESRNLTVYVGTYTKREPHVDGKSRGIHIFRFDTETGELHHQATVLGGVNPSYLALDPERRYLFAVNETGDYATHTSGQVTSFLIDRQSGELEMINQQPSMGASPCYVTVDATGRYVLVANYNGGSVSMLPVQAGGALGAPSAFIQHEGTSVNPQRQDRPHAHSIVVDPGNHYACAADLGLDRILIYRLDLENGKLIANHEQPWARVKAGAGPRHFTFHPNGQYAYVINEIDSTMTAFAYDGSRGTLRELHTLSTLPDDFEGKSWCADVHVHPSGRFVYGSNRGHNSLVVYAVDEATGKLSLVDHTSTEGIYPRNFAIDPSGQFLLAANQNSDNLVVFRIDPKLGKLALQGQVEAATPVCIKMVDLS